MVIQEAIELFKEHQRGAVKKSTLKSYGKFLNHFRDRFSTSEVASVSADQIGKFLEEATEGLSRSTRHLRYAQIKAFFNYVIEVTGLNANNPCTAAVLAKRSSSKSPSQAGTPRWPSCRSILLQGSRST